MKRQQAGLANARQMHEAHSPSLTTWMAHSVVDASLLPGIIGGGSAGCLLLAPSSLLPLCQAAWPAAASAAPGGAASSATARSSADARSSASTWWPASVGWLLSQ